MISPYFETQDAMCATIKEISCSEGISPLNYTKCIRLKVLRKVNKYFLIITLSPCSGLIVTSYSRYLPDKSFETYLSKELEQYKEFKKFSIVDDKTKEFDGKNILY